MLDFILPFEFYSSSVTLTLQLNTKSLKNS